MTRDLASISDGLNEFCFPPFVSVPCKQLLFQIRALELIDSSLKYTIRDRCIVRSFNLSYMYIYNLSLILQISLAIKVSISNDQCVFMIVLQRWNSCVVNFTAIALESIFIHRLFLYSAKDR